MLSQTLFDFRARHEDSRRYHLDVRLKTRVESGGVPTEDQLALARKTIARGAAEPDKPVLVNITGPCPGGSRYLLGGQPVEGEDALKAALAKALAEHRAGRKKPELYTLDVTLKVEVKPGITATEEQIAQARETIKAAGVGRAEKGP
jgi:hypothetical protein